MHLVMVSFLLGRCSAICFSRWKWKLLAVKSQKCQKNNVSGHCNTPHRFQLTLLLTIATTPITQYSAAVPWFDHFIKRRKFQGLIYLFLTSQDRGPLTWPNDICLNQARLHGSQGQKRLFNFSILGMVWVVNLPKNPNNA